MLLEMNTAKWDQMGRQLHHRHKWQTLVADHQHQVMLDLEDKAVEMVVVSVVVIVMAIQQQSSHTAFIIITNINIGAIIIIINNNNGNKAHPSLIQP